MLHGVCREKIFSDWFSQIQQAQGLMDFLLFYNDIMIRPYSLITIELSINKQSVTLDCVIIYEFPAFCKQTPWRIQRSNKEVSM